MDVTKEEPLGVIRPTYPRTAQNVSQSVEAANYFAAGLDFPYLAGQLHPRVVLSACANGPDLSVADSYQPKRTANRRKAQRTSDDDRQERCV